MLQSMLTKYENAFPLINIYALTCKNKLIGPRGEEFWENAKFTKWNSKHIHAIMFALLETVRTIE